MPIAVAQVYRLESEYKQNRRGIKVKLNKKLIRRDLWGILLVKLEVGLSDKILLSS